MHAMRREGGFTLFEMLIVLVIMGVVIGLVAVNLPGRGGGLQMRAAAGALAVALREARAQAIERSETVSIAIDPGRHAFAPDGGAVRRIDASIPISVLPPALPGPGDTRLIRFSPDGSSTGGTVIIGAGHRRLQVSVEWLTGKVSVANAPS